jgi:hypothetical protein
VLRAFLSLILTFAIVPLQAAYDDDVTPPAVPANLEVPDGHEPFLISHAIGTQGYFCVASGSNVWLPFGPEARLFDDEFEQILTHFLSPNPLETVMGPNGTVTVPRATWQHSRDSSAIWAKAVASSSDPTYVAADAIPWLRLEVIGAQEGPTGGDRLTTTTYIQRINTIGGKAPTTACSEQERRALVPYEADYVFYRAASRQHVQNNMK